MAAPRGSVSPKRASTFIGGGLTRVLPTGGSLKARELVFLGKLIGKRSEGDRACDGSLPDASFRDGVYAFAERLATQAPLSIALAKSN
jgi:hypothetical protein